MPFNWLGGKTIGVFSELGAVSQLLAGTVKGGLRAIVAKALIRAVDLIANTRAAGPSALVIVSVVNFLIGAILAFVGAVQLSADSPPISPLRIWLDLQSCAKWPP